MRTDRADAWYSVETLLRDTGVLEVQPWGEEVKTGLRGLMNSKLTSGEVYQFRAMLESVLSAAVGIVLTPTTTWWRKIQQIHDLIKKCNTKEEFQAPDGPATPYQNDDGKTYYVSYYYPGRADREKLADNLTEEESYRLADAINLLGDRFLLP